MSTIILTPEQKRYVTTAIASQRVGGEILEQISVPTTNGTRNDSVAAANIALNTTDYPANCIVRLTGTGLFGYDLDYADDDYKVGDELYFIQVHSGATVSFTGTDTGGTHELPVINSHGTSTSGVGITRVLRKVSLYTDEVEGGLDQAPDQLLSSITVNVTGGTIAAYPGVALTTVLPGTGAGAIATVTLDAAANISAIDITTSGSGYKAGDTLTIAAALLGAGSTEVTIVLKQDDLDGTVAAEWDNIRGGT